MQKSGVFLVKTGKVLRLSCACVRANNLCAQILACAYMCIYPYIYTYNTPHILIYIIISYNYIFTSGDFLGKSGDFCGGFLHFSGDFLGVGGDFFDLTLLTMAFTFSFTFKPRCQI